MPLVSLSQIRSESSGQAHADDVHFRLREISACLRTEMSRIMTRARSGNFHPSGRSLQCAPSRWCRQRAADGFRMSGNVRFEKGAFERRKIRTVMLDNKLAEGTMTNAVRTLPSRVAAPILAFRIIPRLSMVQNPIGARSYGSIGLCLTEFVALRLKC